jgi:hypothetical protein
LGPIPFLGQSADDLLLLPYGKIGVPRIPFSVSPFDEGHGILSASDLREDHVALLQPPTGLNRILRMRGKPKIVLIDVVECDGTIL